MTEITLQWRHNGCNSISNHQTHDCLFNCLFRRRSKKTSKLRVTCLFAGNSPRNRWIHRTNGQSRGKCFRLMTSSWHISWYCTANMYNNINWCAARQQTYLITKRHISSKILITKWTTPPRSILYCSPEWYTHPIYTPWTRKHPLHPDMSLPSITPPDGDIPVEGLLVSRIKYVRLIITLYQHYVCLVNRQLLIHQYQTLCISGKR